MKRHYLVHSISLLLFSLHWHLTYSDTAQVQVEEDASFSSNGHDSLFSIDQIFDYSFAIHRNGESNPCGSASPSLKQLLQATSSFGNLQDTYQLESFLTKYFSLRLDPPECTPVDEEHPLYPGFLGYCDMGPNRTVIQLDHEHLVRVPETNSLPCRFYTREGLRMSSLEQWIRISLSSSGNQEQMQHIYAVPAGRVFFFAPSHVGDIFELAHVRDSMGRNLVLQTLSVEPKVFDIYHFFSQDERQTILHEAMLESSDTHKFQPSRTGSANATSYSKRTSETCWVSKTETAMAIKTRGFHLLGFEDYRPELSDGLQVLRYNTSKAYTPHLDYLRDRKGTNPYDFETAGKGGNRFATILLYFSDLEEGAGGETVFTDAWPPGQPENEHVELKDAIQQLRESGDASMLQRGSWEEEMVAQCRTRLAVRPNATRAVLFYSQLPNGEPDPKSRHGGCPVLKGTKLAANLWTWSASRSSWELAPQKNATGPPKATSRNAIRAIFKNSGADPRFDETTEVFYKHKKSFGKLVPNGNSLRVTTYKGHEWNVKVRGETVITFTVQPSPAEQEFVV